MAVGLALASTRVTLRSLSCRIHIRVHTHTRAQTHTRIRSMSRFGLRITSKWLLYVNPTDNVLQIEFLAFYFIYFSLLFFFGGAAVTSQRRTRRSTSTSTSNNPAPELPLIWPGTDSSRPQFYRTFASAFAFAFTSIACRSRSAFNSQLIDTLPPCL